MDREKISGWVTADKEINGQIVPCSYVIYWDSTLPRLAWQITTKLAQPAYAHPLSTVHEGDSSVVEVGQRLLRDKVSVEVFFDVEDFKTAAFFYALEHVEEAHHVLETLDRYLHKLDT